MDERESLSESTHFLFPVRRELFLIHPVVPFHHTVVDLALVEGECVLTDIAAGREREDCEGVDRGSQDP